MHAEYWPDKTKEGYQLEDLDVSLHGRITVNRSLEKYSHGMSLTGDDCLLGCCEPKSGRSQRLATEAASSSEMSINLYQVSGRNIVEASSLHTRLCENLNPRLSLTS